jgi:unsaturated rhamnogalacturonyl hydrolase
MDVLADRALGKGKTVMLDYYFNSEHHKDITGTNIRFHYIWDEMDNNGYSLWGHLFRQYGAKTDSLPVAPTADNLKKASVYIIVDPDNEKESPSPNFIQANDVTAIEAWVKAGGVLVLMGNDSANMEFDHFNNLAGKFGIHFNFDDYHKVTGSQYEMGAFSMGGQDAIFPTNQKIFLTTDKIYIKELSTLKLDGTARAHFTDKGNVIMGVAKVGRGTVFAVGDPWLYNEYTDGRKLPADFQNFNAARDLTRWLIRQTK